MSDKHSKPRQQAETAFSREQSQFFARTRAYEELDAITAARDEKTMRLREARLAKELRDTLAATAKSPAKRTR
ncbi:hypothetical protein [Pannonibacter phragmitetus]|uniref:hypothetical protein n=1 Tax=Pannonibacter phragmitetus TaxID=121719 RepID=UPI003D2EAECC